MYIYIHTYSHINIGTWYQNLFWNQHWWSENQQNRLCRRCALKTYKYMCTHILVFPYTSIDIYMFRRQNSLRDQHDAAPLKRVSTCIHICIYTYIYIYRHMYRIWNYLTRNYLWNQHDAAPFKHGSTCTHIYLYLHVQTHWRKKPPPPGGFFFYRSLLQKRPMCLGSLLGLLCFLVKSHV